MPLLEVLRLAQPLQECAEHEKEYDRQGRAGRQSDYPGHEDSPDHAQVQRAYAACYPYA